MSDLTISENASKKYTMEIEDNLFRIIALIDIPSVGVKIGDRGGLIEKEVNLSHENNAWVSSNALVFGNARVSGDARVFGDALVSGNPLMYGYTQI